MARPTTIRDADILDAAREVFLSRGIRATTAEVADRAGVSEGTIFNRFKTKSELFRVAMLGTAEDAMPEWLGTLEARVGKGNVQKHLIEIALGALEFFRKFTPLMMMSWSSTGSNGLPAHFDTPNPAPIRALKRVAGYFEAEMKLGRLARQDPEIVARVFLGTLWNFAVFELFTQGKPSLPLPAETFVRGLIQLVWEGLEPRGSRRTR